MHLQEIIIFLFKIAFVLVNFSASLNAMSFLINVFLFIVVDGDIVPAVPSSGYKHIGINVIVDNGTGSIIIDPSYVEKFLRVKRKVSVGAHSLNVYLAGLYGIKIATEYFNNELERTRSRNTTLNEDIESLTLQQRITQTAVSDTDTNIFLILLKSSREASRRASEVTEQGTKQNEEVLNIDEWAENIKEPTLIQRFKTLIWKEETILSSTESTLHNITTTTTITPTNDNESLLNQL